MTEGKISEWLKGVGDKVDVGDMVLVVDSDKADMDVEDKGLDASLGEIGEQAPATRRAPGNQRPRLTASGISWRDLEGLTFDEVEKIERRLASISSPRGEAPPLWMASPRATETINVQGLRAGVRAVLGLVALAPVGMMANGTRHGLPFSNALLVPKLGEALISEEQLRKSKVEMRFYTHCDMIFHAHDAPSPRTRAHTRAATAAAK